MLVCLSCIEISLQFLSLKVTLEALSEGTSGLVNSDWHVLKFSGYMLKEGTVPRGKNVRLRSAKNDTTS